MGHHMGDDVPTVKSAVCLRPGLHRTRCAVRIGAPALAAVSLLAPALPAQEPGALPEQRMDARLRAAMTRAVESEPLPVLIEYEAPAPEPVRSQAQMIARLQRQAASTLVGLDSLAASVGGGIEIRERFWIVPAALADAVPSSVVAMAGQPGVRHVYLDERIAVTLEPTVSGLAIPAFTSTAMQTIGADVVWERGVTGEGVTVAFFDTGVDGANAMLASRWRGRRTIPRASWFDPFLRSSEPQDLIGHGTQVAAAAVGALPAGDTLRFPDGSSVVALSDIDVVTGSAPRAEWIAARVFEVFGGAVYTRRSVLLQAFQWALDPDGNPATEDSPEVINNSWGVLEGESQFGLCDDVVYDAIDVAEGAGIAVLFASGNTGPDPASVTPPGARDDPNLRSLAVGATSGSGGTISVADFSGRGPSPCGGGIKPEIVAPGTVPEVRADGAHAARLTGFSRRGTSFSVAQLSGAVALMRQLRPGAGPEEAKRLLLDSAADLPPVGPDNDTGFGLLDVPAAVRRVDPAFAGSLLQLTSARRSGDSVVIELVNRGDGPWSGGEARLEAPSGGPVHREVPELAAGDRTAIGVELEPDLAGATSLQVTVLDRSGSTVLSRSVYVAPPNLFGAYVLEDGDLAAGGNDFGRFGRVAAFQGFSWKGREMLPAAAFFVAGGGRISDGMYSTVLGRSDLKSSPPAAETDWAPRRSLTDVEPARASFHFDDFEALQPIGLEVAARAEATDRNGVGAVTLTATIRNLSGGRIADLLPGMFVDWDFGSGETAAWSPQLEALVSAPTDSTAPVAVLAGDHDPVARAAVPLGTPGPGRFYEAGSGVLVSELTESVKLDLARGMPPDGLPGFGAATDQAQLLSVGPFDLETGQAVTVRFWFLAADSEQAAAARLAELRAEQVQPPGLTDSFAIEPPFPNPLRVGQGVMTFSYSVPESAGGDELVFEIYDVAGRRLVRQRITVPAAGAPPRVTWDGRLDGGREAASGVYLFVFRLGEETRSGRAVIVR